VRGHERNGGVSAGVEERERRVLRVVIEINYII